MSDALPVPESQLVPAHLVPAAAAGTSEQFLRVHLLEMIVLLPVQQLSEVLTIPIGQIVPIPHMPAWVMGVYNWRGEILWMVDLGHLCGLTPWYQQPSGPATHSAIVLQRRERKSAVRGQTLGLVVHRIDDMEQCNPELIQSLPLSTVSPELAPFLRGYWWKSDDDMLAVLNSEAIFAAMPKL